jgi:hypothetical protein
MSARDALVILDAAVSEAELMAECAIETHNKTRAGHRRWAKQRIARINSLRDQLTGDGGALLRG